MERLAVLWLSIAILFSCSQDDNPIDFEIGKNQFVTSVDGEQREYNVHVPQGYDGSLAFPVVIMMHGGGGSGDQTYNDSGWKELAEEENILSVFPTSWRYCWIKPSGEVRNNVTRWNSFPGIFEFCEGESPRDDVKFLRKMVQEIKDNFSIDEGRIYMVGFSSGAQMSFRCAVEMNEILAAVVQSGGTHQIDNINTSVNGLPMALELGNVDDTWFDVRQPPSIESFNELLDDRFQRIIEIHAKTFGFETEYQITTQALTSTAVFDGIPDAERKFIFTLIDGLDHSYPNTVTHPIYGAMYHWDWMKQYSR